MMEIVIKIPEGYYNAIKSIPDKQCDADMLIIKNGTPLPKGHGRLIDADAKNKELVDEYHGMISDESIKIYKIIQMLDEAPTIIEADKESKE